MNQTNFGYNPARNTIVTGKQAAEIIIDSFNSTLKERASLNTQKRNRTQRIESNQYVSPQSRHYRNTSLVVGDLQSTY